MAGTSYNGPIKINADGTFTPPWGGKFWLHKITGKVDRQDANRTSHSSYEYASHETHYVGNTSVSLPVTRTGSITMHNSSFDLIDNNGINNHFYLNCLVVGMEDGDILTVIKSDQEGIRETTDIVKPEFKKQVKFMYNHNTNKEWTYNHPPIKSFIKIMLIIFSVMCIFSSAALSLIYLLSGGSSGFGFLSQGYIMTISMIVVTVIYIKIENKRRNIMSQFFRWYSLAESNTDKQ